VQQQHGAIRLLAARKNDKLLCAGGSSTDLPGALFSFNIGRTAVSENKRL
jgi:hypothetical protein